MQGTKIDNFWVNLRAIEVDIREGILFKILSRIA